VRTYFDLHGREVALGRCLGRGGEGAVYAIPHRPRLIAIGAASPSETLAWPGRPQRPEPYGRSPQVEPELVTALLAWRQELLPDMEAAHRRLAQARADLAAL
jgi:DNA-binding helix-hairpin-helix protein with protein kinase domain